MKYLKHIVIPLFLFVISCSIDNKTLLTIGDSQYSVEDFKQAFTFEPNDDSIAKRGKIEDYVNQMLVYEEAKSLGYEDDPVVRAAYETNEKDIIWRSYYNDEVVAKINVRDSEIRELYNKIIDQYHLSQIVVAEESLANYLEAELRKGTSFEDLQAYSLDTLSENGDIGTFSVVSIPPEIMSEIKNVQEGGVSKPIKFGDYYMLFKVIEHTISEEPKFEDVKENIRQNLWQEKIRAEGEKYYNNLMEKAKVEYNQKGLDILVKPESLITEEDLNTWVVKKYDTSYVYVRTILNAVQYMRSSARVDPKYLIDRELVPDLVYDDAIRKYYHKRPSTRKKLESTRRLLVYQKLYSNSVIEKATVDSSEVVEYYNAHPEEYKDKNLSQAFSIIKAQLRDKKVDILRTRLFTALREKYEPVINEVVVAQLLKEEA
jgi:parvulin-like peptidyl-prolyl isomerase